MVDERIDLGDTLEETVAVENQGETIGTKDIELLIDSVVEDTASDVTVDVGVTKTKTLTWDSTGESAQQYTVKAQSPDDSYSYTLEVVDPTGTDFYLVDIDSTNSPVAEKDTLDVDATIENVGDQSGTQTVVLKIDGTQEDSQSVSLGADATDTVTFNWDSAGAGTGDKTARIESADDFDESTISVEQSSGFTVTINGTNEPIEEGSRLDVTATIENTGVSSDSQIISLDMSDGVGTVDSQNVSLGRGNSKTITLSWQTSDGDGQSSDYTATVSSLDNSDTASVTIQEGPGDTATTIWSTSTPDAPAAIAESQNAYMAEADGIVYAYDKSDGTQLWSDGFGGGLDQALAANGAVYIAESSSQAEVAKFDESGSEQWSVVKSEGFTDLAVGQYDGNVVLFATSTSGDLVTFSDSDGGEVERINLSDSPESIAVDNEDVYIGGENFTLIRVEVDTQSVNSPSQSEEVTKTINASSSNTLKSIAATNNTVTTNVDDVVRNYDRSIVKQWENTISGVTNGIDNSRGRVWAIDSNENLRGFDVETGAEDFSDNLGGSSNFLDLAVDGVDVYAVNSDNTFRYDVT